MVDKRLLIDQLQVLFNDRAIPADKIWFENYLRNTIVYRGLKLPQVRNLVKDWYQKNHLKDLAINEQIEIALMLIQSDFAEDKLAGILYLELYLYDRVDWQIMLPRYQELYDRGAVFDWSTNDWFCMRVFGPTIATYGAECADRFSDWSTATNLWQARASIVAFVKVAADRTYDDQLDRSMAILIQRSERFAKTAVGWVLREISKHDRDLAIAFIDRHLRSFSIESLRNATKYFDPQVTQNYIDRLKKEGKLRERSGGGEI
jgi:3-methyladenine DNA glycosylase AlkD